MDKSIIFSVLLIILTGIGYYFWQEHQASLVLMETDSSTRIEPADASAKLIKQEEKLYPVPAAEIKAQSQTESKTIEALPLPVLNDSDIVLQQGFAEFYQAEKLQKIFVFKNFIRHFVVTIDNMPMKKLPGRFVFTQKIETGFMVSSSSVDNEYFLDQGNYSRYQLFIDFADAVDNEQLVSLYVRYYSLFQEAYDELGYVGRYFNDRLVEVIDHLLQTPEVSGPIKLHRPKVFYQFADPKLEALSAGQKILVRMGPDNANKVKTRLKQLRHIVTTLKRGE